MKDQRLYIRRLQPKQVQKHQDQRRQIFGHGIGRAINMVINQRGGSNESNRGYEDEDRSMKR